MDEATTQLARRIDLSTQEFPLKLAERLAQRQRKMHLLGEPLSHLLSEIDSQLESERARNTDLQTAMSRDPDVIRLTDQVDKLINLEGFYQSQLAELQAEWIAQDSRQEKLRLEVKELRLMLNTKNRVLKGAGSRSRVKSYMLPGLREDREKPKEVNLDNRAAIFAQHKSIPIEKGQRWEKSVMLQPKKPEEIDPGRKREIELKKALAQTKLSCESLNRQLGELVGRRNAAALQLRQFMQGAMSRVQSKINHLDSKLIQHKQLFVRFCESVRSGTDEYKQEQLLVGRRMAWQQFSKFSPEELMIIMATYPYVYRRFKPLRPVFLDGSKVVQF